MKELLIDLIAHPKKVFKWFVGLLVAFLFVCNINLSTQNKKLSEGLEMAQNNIEAYQGSLQESWSANNVLKLDFD